MALSDKGRGLDTFNDSLRANEAYRAFLRSIGADPDGPLQLSGEQRSAAEQWVRQTFGDQIGGRLQIDPAGNLNTDHGLSTAWSNPYFRYPLLAGGTLATMGALGAFSGAAGAGAGAGGASAAGGGLLGSSAIPGLHAAIPGAVGGGIGGGAAGGGLLGTLGSIGSGIRSQITSDPVGTLGRLGGAAAGAAQGSANQRIAETPGQVAAFNANLNATQLGDRRAALASLLGGGLQDASIGRPEGSTIPRFQISGGLRPSAMNQSALLQRLGQTIDPLELPKAGFGEKLLGGIGLGGSLLGALGGLAKRPPIMNAGAR